MHRDTTINITFTSHSCKHTCTLVIRNTFFDHVPLNTFTDYMQKSFWMRYYNISVFHGLMVQLPTFSYSFFSQLHSFLFPVFQKLLCSADFPSPWPYPHLFLVLVLMFEIWSVCQFLFEYLIPYTRRLIRFIKCFTREDPFTRAFIF